MPPDTLLPPLLDAVPDRPVRRVVIGLNWTLVEAGDGCGLAHTPARDAPGCRAVEGAGGLAARGLRALAGLVRSGNPVEVAVGLAALNAAFNTATVAGVPLNGLDAFAADPTGTVVVGRFPGLAARLPGCTVVERRPGPGEVAEAEAAPHVARATGLLLTASALANGGVTRFLALAPPGCRVALVGPGTPLTPLLHAAGIGILAGTVVTDADAAARIVAEGGTVRTLAAATRPVTLVAPAG